MLHCSTTAARCLEFSFFARYRTRITGSWRVAGKTGTKRTPMIMKNIRAALAAAILALALVPANASQASAQCGKASWYALTSKTASGEHMKPEGMTAAHRSLPLGSRIKVTNKRNGKTVILRVNDRGPFIKGRIVDVSKGAARKLGFIGAGHTNVCIARI